MVDLLWIVHEKKSMLNYSSTLGHFITIELTGYISHRIKYTVLSIDLFLTFGVFQANIVRVVEA